VRLPHPVSIFVDGLIRMDRPSRLVFLAPILAFQIYLNATLIVFVSGFWPWPLQNWMPVVSYLIAAHMCLLGGFVFAAGIAPGQPTGDLVTNRVLWAVIVVNLFLLVPTTVSRTGELVPDLVRAWRDYGEVYVASLALRASRTHVVEYVRILIGYLIIPLVPLVVFYWHDMSRPMRALGAFTVVWTVALGFAMGINKPIAELAGMVLVFGVARRLSTLSPRPARGRINYMLIAAAVTAAFGLSFYRSQTERLGETKGRTAYTIGSPVPDKYVRPKNTADPSAPEGRARTRSQVIQARRDFPLVESLPLPVVVFLERGALYLTQGYYALGLALELPWQPTWGVGHSFFTIDNAARWFPAVLSRPYPMRIEAFGWDAYRSWSSFYPWVASDLSFAGTLVLMFMIGLGTGVSWRDTLNGASPFAVAAFGCFLVVILYLPANNQMLQFGEGWTATWGILAAWLLVRRRMGPGLHRATRPTPP